MWFGRLPASTSITGGCCWPQAYAPLLESKVPSEPGEGRGPSRSSPGVRTQK